MYILHNSVMWRDSANHTALATFSFCHYDESHTKSSSILFRAAFVTDTSADQQGKMAADCREVIFVNLCEIWPSSRVKHTLAVSPHARPVCFHLNNSNDSQHLFPEMIQRSRQSVFWWSGCCLRMSFNSAIVWSLQ